MKLKIVAVFASVLLVATGAAMAMPGNAPDHAQDGNAQADDHSQSGDRAEDDADEFDSNATESDSDARRGPPADVPAAGGADDANGSQGPPVEMPEQVPDFVSGVHETIGNVAGGAVDGARSLGEKISALTPDGADAAGNASADDIGNATATPAP
ncbi:hypothetical protein [Halosimplex pelagicum]|uniref:Uncharacterized protein n=1 Tax=Halosimplex pelagicum TaxID=869886 RepID=A0A7D5P7C7_9EURY|nr:hypothetical protein [Halosimplex pelagicum]QLH82543.1 hypothetical protein HZS54_13365 [Halosimplex pelagicum]